MPKPCRKQAPPACCRRTELTPERLTNEIFSLLDQPAENHRNGRARARAWRGRAPWKISWTCSKRLVRAMNVTFRNFQRIHLVGIGGSGMSGIAEVLLSQRLRSFRLRSEAVAGHRAAAQAGRDAFSKAITPENVHGAHVVVISSAVRTRQRRSGRSAPAENSGDPARRNAGRTDAPEIRHRRRRRARQNHHHFDGRRPCWRLPGSIPPSSSAAA